MKTRFIILIIIQLFIITISSYIIYSRTNLSTKIEAVNMEFTNYKYDYYVGKKLIKIAGDVGTTSYTFKGMPAVYDLDIAYVDEDDGNSTFTLNVDGENVFTWVADINPTKDNIFTKTVKNLKLSHDSKIVITGVRNKGEGARLAHLEIKYVNGISPLLFMNHALSQFFNNISLISALLTIFVILLILVINILVFIILRHRHSPKYSLSTPKSNPLSISTALDNYLSSDIKTNSTDYDESTKNELVTNYNPIPFVIPSESLNVIPDQINSVPNGPSKPLVSDQMISYIKTKYADSNFSVQEMADHFNMSLNYLSSYFKEQTGQNIICYLTELRIEKAKQLLLSSDLAIKNVAECSGYFNVSSFIRRFKQIMGVTPREYRLNNKNSNPVSKEDIL